MKKEFSIVKCSVKQRLNHRRFSGFAGFSVTLQNTHLIKYVLCILWLLLIFTTSSNLTAQTTAGNISEKEEDWISLFDGKTTKSWRSAYGTTFPENGWIVKDGELRGELTNGMAQHQR